jgi:hypothetical protein
MQFRCKTAPVLSGRQDVRHYTRLRRISKVYLTEERSAGGAPVTKLRQVTAAWLGLTVAQKGGLLLKKKKDECYSKRTSPFGPS